MSIAIRLYIARILCLLMAVFLLNFSIDSPVGSHDAITATDAGKIFVTNKTEQAKTILSIALAINLTIEQEFPENRGKENKGEAEAKDEHEFLNSTAYLSDFYGGLYPKKQHLRVPGINLKTLYQDVSSPPPKAFLFNRGLTAAVFS